LDDDNGRGGDGGVDDRDDETLAVGGDVEADVGVGSGEGGGIDGEEWLGGAEFWDGPRGDGNGVDSAIEAEIEELAAVFPPTDGAGTEGGGSMARADQTGGVAAFKRLEVEFGAAGFVGGEGEPLGVGGEGGVGFVETGGEEGDDFSFLMGVGEQDIALGFVGEAGGADIGEDDEAAVGGPVGGRLEASAG